MLDVLAESPSGPEYQQHFEWCTTRHHHHPFPKIYQYALDRHQDFHQAKELLLDILLSLRKQPFPFQKLHQLVDCPAADKAES